MPWLHNILMRAISFKRILCFNLLSVTQLNTETISFLIHDLPTYDGNL